MSQRHEAGSPRRGRGTWLSAVAVVVGLTVLALPWVAPRLASTGERAGRPASVSTPGVPTPHGARLPRLRAEPAVRLSKAPAAPARPAVPTRLVVPALHVDAPVVPISAPGGVLLPPSDPQVLGWWRDGAEPGAATGSALLTGHTVHTGGGAFDDLETLRPGDAVQIQTRRGRLRYVVSTVRIYRKATLAHDAARLFSQTVPGRLVLVTCEDWNGSTYLSNAVVVARLA